MAVQFWLNRGVRTRKKFLVFSGGYHGDTSGAMAICDPEAGMHAPFRGLVPEHHVVDLPQDGRARGFVHMLERHAAELAGIVVEPLVQGAGGMRFHDAASRALRAAADRHDLLLVFDEIFTGFGRTGALFACEAAGVVPDIVTLSKALTGNAAAGRDRRQSKGLRRILVGRPHACADARPGPSWGTRSLRRRQCLARPVRARAAPAAGAEIAAALERGLAPCRTSRHQGRARPGRDRRGRASIASTTSLRARFVEEGVFVRPFGSIVYLTPAFTIAEEELARLTGAAGQVVAAALVTSAFVSRASRRDPDQSREAQHRLRWR